MKKVRGLTIVELVVIVIFAGLAALVFLYQRSNIVASQRDETRKTAINAMYYNLEEVFYEKHGYYPSSISEKNLTAMNPELFTDPHGVKLGEPNSDYRYDAINCQAERCKAYRLTARLDKEADYVKTSRNS